MKRRDTRQGVYFIVAGPLLYAGSTAGGKGRGFDARWDEHIKLLREGRHHNGALQRQFTRDGGKGWFMVKLPGTRGDIPGARLIEGHIIRTMGKAVCNERR